MIRLIWAKIEHLRGNKANCRAISDDKITFSVYLNPLDQHGQAETKQGSRIIALVDDVQGLGVCVYNEDGFAFKFGQDLSISGDVDCHDCSVIARGLVTSLASHVHNTTAPGSPTDGPIAPPGV